VRRQPIRWAGEVVGYIMLYPVRRLDQETDLRFEADLLRTLWVIAALILLVAGFAGRRLSRSLLAPVRDLASGARALAAGRYGTRLHLTRSDEFGALGRDFNRLAEALEQARSARQRWLADVAHELRTPLTVLRGELEALEDGVRPLTPQNLGSLNTEVRQLGRLVEDLHALALADAGALAFEYEPCQPQRLLEDAFARHQRRFEEAGLALGLDPGPSDFTLSLDPLRIAQLLDNVLENALRYTDAPGEVRLRLEPEGQGARLIVEDSAPGVSDEAREAMFTRFWRQEASRARASGGAGLGLAIVRRISRAHEGDAFAEPSPLGGVRISILLRTQEPEGGRP
jgi:two-component system sensor histidine kinase BaeS